VHGTPRPSKVISLKNLLVAVKRLHLVNSLGSKLFSIRALADVFDHWPALLRVYFFGGHAQVWFHDYRGTEFPLIFDRTNVNMAITFARASFKTWRKYEVTDDIICIPFNQYRPSFRLSEVLSNITAFGCFLQFCFLSNSNADVRPLDEDHYAVSLEDLTWVVRKGHQGDMEAGPLLPRTFESHEYRNWFLPTLNRGGIFIDVGANIGGYSVRACKLGAEVISLEPDTETFSLLVRNLAANECSKVRPLKVAAGATDGKVALYAPDDSGYAYSFGREGKFREYVMMKPLDEVASALIGDSEVQLTKIDVEGAELEVVRGAARTLGKSRYLMIEMWPHNEELLDSLRKLNFKLVDVGRRWSKTKEVNLLFRKT
jgi:FkbM family methyltransferase